MNKLIETHNNELIKTDLTLEIPKGLCGQIIGRSGLALKYSITAHHGLTDSVFRGILCVILFNNSIKTYQVPSRDRIGQIIFTKVQSIKFMEVSELRETDW